MRKLLALVALVSGAAGLLYVAAAWHAGRVVEDEVVRYGKLLAELDRVYVYELAYERRLFAGQIRYDLAFRPMPDDPVRPFLRDVFGDAADPKLRTSGRIDVRHGPWAGGPAWARLRGETALPPALREALPQYPGQAPWIIAEAKIGLLRDLVVDVRMTDYNGRIVQPTADKAGRLTVAGLNGRLSVASAAPRFRLDLRLDEISMSEARGDKAHLNSRGIRLESELDRDTARGWSGRVRGSWSGLAFGNHSASFDVRQVAADLTFGFDQTASSQHRTARGSFEVGSMRAESTGADRLRASVAPLRFDLDIAQDWPHLWTGKLGLDLQEVAAQSEAGKVRIGSLSVRNESVRRSAYVDQVVTLTAGPLESDGFRLPGASLQMSVRNVDGAATNDILELVDEAFFDPTILDNNRHSDRMAEAARRILVGGPSLQIDRLALHVVEPGDVDFSLGMGLAADPGLSWNRPEELWKALEARASVSVRSSALQELARIAVAIDAAGNGERLPPRAVLEREASRRHAEWMSNLANNPLIVVAAVQVHADAQLKAGQLVVNGRPLELSDVIGSIAAAGGGATRNEPGLAGSASMGSNVSSGAAVETLRLSADFEPDPRRVRVTAGGRTELDGSLGEECVGFVDVTRPNVELIYQSGKSDLFIYASSPEDTALIVRTPSGAWHCSDDAPGQGLDPLVQVRNPLPGSYKIWVATVEGKPAGATLLLSRRGSAEGR
jgi:hypothetical protein